ncbi:hypothetical protein BH11PLA2_BH11PLA2_24990 [soil metagenome]
MRRPARRSSLPIRFLELEDRCTPATLTVNSALDVVSPDANLTLREAINTVNSQSTASLSAAEKALITGTLSNSDTISFASSLNGSTITLNGTSRLNLQRPMSITGPGADKLTINGGKNGAGTTGTQIFFLDGRAFPTVGDWKISGLTLTNANARAGTGTTAGGLDNSIRGGAIFNDAADNVSIDRCTISESSANFGGGVYTFNGTTTISRSTILNNVGRVNGGGVVNNTPTNGQTILEQCTLSGNNSIGFAGAINNAAGFTTLRQSTVVNNQAFDVAQAGTAPGGGIVTADSQFTILDYTVVANNTGFSNARADISGSVGISGNNNYISDPATAGGLTHNTNGNILGNGAGSYRDPGLSPLQFNGGTMPTYVPLSGSPLIDGASNAVGLATDARGFPRQADVNGTPDTGTVDIGATERVSQAFTIEVNDNSGLAVVGSMTNLTNAIRISNQNLGTQTITFNPTVFATPQTITLAPSSNVELSINDAVTITGPANARVTIDAQGKSRIFNTSGASTKAAISLNNLTLTGGFQDTTVGGAIIAEDELLQAINCNFTNNMAVAGGAIAFIRRGIAFSSGVLDLANCTISGNTATSSGGGVFFNYSGSATIVDTAIINNKSVATGGGFYFFGPATGNGLTFRNSTISGNTAGSNGGGISLASFIGTLVVQNSTIVTNTASGQGGGIDNPFGGGGLLLQSTIVSGNQAPNGADISSSTLVNATNSAIGVTGTFGFGTSTGTIIGQNLLLGPLANNGGSTLTHLPAANSPLKNAGSNPSNLPNDARGNGFPRSADGGVDIGAVEVTNQSSTTTTLTVNNPNPQFGNPITFTATVQSGSGLTPTGTVTFSVDGAATSVIALVGGSASFPTSSLSVGNHSVSATYNGNGNLTGSSSNAVNVLVVATNTPPTITTISNRTSSGAPVSTTFTVNDVETPLANLSFTASSNNSALVPNGNVSFSGTGENRTVTVTPAGGKVGFATITVTVTDGNGGTASSAFVVTVRNLLENEFSVGRDRTAQASVTLNNPNNTPRFMLTPFGTSFTGGIRNASGDVTGDGVADLIVASGPGMPGTVKVFDGVTQQQLALPESVAGGGTPFGSTFTKGIIVAVGDLNADGLSDLIITAEAGGGARVRIFQSTGTGFTQRSDFIALIGGDNKADGNFRGGSRATVSDINGDGTGDLIWAAGAGGGPRIATFNGTQLNNGSNAAFKLSGDFFALATTLRDGCYLGGGDIDGDGIGDVVFGGGSGAPPQVVGYSGANIVQNKFVRFLDFNFGTNSGQGIRVAVKDLNNDNIADVIVGSAPGAGSRVAAFNGNNLRGSSTGASLFDFTAFAGFSGGVFVG